MIFKKILLYTFITFTLVACGENKTTVVTNNDGEQISYIHQDDKDMNNAMSKAQSTFDDFKKIFKENQNNPKFDSFTVRLGFDSSQFGKEYMWLTDLKLQGDILTGSLANEPEDDSIPYKYGSLITVNPVDVTDWMYIEIVNDSTEITHGGYTIRVIRDKMSPKERASFDESNGLYFED